MNENEIIVYADASSGGDWTGGLVSPLVEQSTSDEEGDEDNELQDRT